MSSPQMPAAPGNAFVSASISETPAFQPVATVIGYDEAKYQATPEIAVEPTIPTPPVEEVSKSNKAEESHKLAQQIKMERKLSQKQKEAELIIAKAEAYRAAFSSTDPIDALQKLGLQPNEIYRKLTDFVLKEEKPAEPQDPIKAELADTRKKLDSYAEIQEQMKQELQTERESLMHMQAMNTTVAPIINNNPEKYETLIHMFDGNKEAAIQNVYENMYKTFLETGETYTAESAADAMEAYWSEQYQQVLDKAGKLNKFKKYLKDPEEEAKKIAASTTKKPLTQAERFANLLAADQETNTVAPEKIFSQPKTLTNNMNNSVGGSSSSGQVKKYISPITDRNAYIDSLLKR